MKTGLLLAAAGLFAVDLSAQGRVQRPMTFEDFAAVRNVGGARCLVGLAGIAIRSQVRTEARGLSASIIAD